MKREKKVNKWYLARALRRTMIIWWNMIIENILSSGSGWANKKISLYKPCNPHKSYNQCTCWHNISKHIHAPHVRNGFIRVRRIANTILSTFSRDALHLFRAMFIKSSLNEYVFEGGEMKSKVGDRRYVKKEIDHVKNFSQNVII